MRFPFENENFQTLPNLAKILHVGGCQSATANMLLRRRKKSKCHRGFLSHQPHLVQCYVWKYIDFTFNCFWCKVCTRVFSSTLYHCLLINFWLNWKLIKNSPGMKYFLLQTKQFSQNRATISFISGCLVAGLIKNEHWLSPNSFCQAQPLSQLRPSEIVLSSNNTALTSKVKRLCPIRRSQNHF